VASDSNDFVSSVSIRATTGENYRKQFLESIYKTNNYRKITKTEACRIQGFPEHFILPDTRSKWMKLIGNSVSVPVLEIIIHAISDTGVFNCEYDASSFSQTETYAYQPSLETMSEQMTLFEKGKKYQTAKQKNEVIPNKKP